jgi:hypothetical protein
VGKKKESMLPNLSSLSLHAAKEEATDARLRSNQSGNLLHRQTRSLDLSRPINTDQLGVRKKRLPYIENVLHNGNWASYYGSSYSKYIDSLKGVNPKLRIDYDRTKGFMLKARPVGQEVEGQTTFEAGELICIVSGIYCSKEAYNTLSISSKDAQDNYKFRVVDVVKPSELGRLAAEVERDPDKIRETTFFKDIETTEVLLCPRFQTSFYEETSPGQGQYIPLPSQVYTPGQTNVPLMWDPYAPSLQKKYLLKGELDVGFLANHATASMGEKPNAAVRPFIVKPKDENSDRIVFAMFAIENIDPGFEVLIDYGYEPLEPDPLHQEQSSRVSKATVDDYAIISKCLRPAGIATIQGQATPFYDAQTRSKTCIFGWPYWESSWAQMAPYAKQCGPRVAAMQFGISKSFSVLVASMENDELSNHGTVNQQGQIVSSLLEETLMNAATYVPSGILGEVPRHRSLAVESARERASDIFNKIMNKLDSTTITLEKLALDSNDAYQASSDPSLTDAARARRDSLLDLYDAIDALSNSIPIEEFSDKRVVDAIIKHLHTDTFLSTLGELDNAPVLESDNYPQIIKWSKSTYALMSGLKDAYAKYTELHKSFFAVEDDEIQEVDQFPDVIDYWYDLTDRIDIEPPQPSPPSPPPQPPVPPPVLHDPNDRQYREYRIYQPEEQGEPQDGFISDTGSTATNKLHLRLKI